MSYLLTRNCQKINWRTRKTRLNWIREILTGMSTGQKMERRESLNPTISQSKKDVWQSWTIGIRMVLHGTIWNVKISCHLFVKGRFHSENMNFYDDCSRNLFVCNRRDKMQYPGGLLSRELGQAPMLLVFLTPRQALSSHPHQQMVWPTAAHRWHFVLQDVSCQQSCHLLTPIYPRFTPVQCDHTIGKLSVDAGLLCIA